MKVKNIIAPAVKTPDEDKLYAWIRSLPAFSRKAVHMGYNGLLNSVGPTVRIEENHLRGRGKDRGVPYKFDFVRGSFSIIHCDGLTSLKNFPNEVTGDLLIFDNRNLTSLDGLTRKIGKTLSFSGSGVSSISGLHRRVDFIGPAAKKDGVLQIPDLITSHLLSPLLIPGLGKISCRAIPFREILTKACDIVTSHLQGDRDVLACQEALIDNDLEEFAQL